MNSRPHHKKSHHQPKKAPTLPVLWIDQPEMLAAFCRRLARHSLFSFDTEFIREKTFKPVLALIQISSPEEVGLIDTLALSKEQMAPLLELFLSREHLKILHAAQGDQECLYFAYGITAKNTFDTAQGASLLGFGENVGLARLLKDLLGVSLPKGHARTDWTVRPLPPQLRDYAAGDVEHLVPLAERLLSKLDGKNRRAWAMELSRRWESEEAFSQRPEQMASRYAKSGRYDGRALAALTRLLAWRDERALQLDIPRRRICEDDVLTDLAQVRPQSMDHLVHFRGLHGKEIQRSGEKLIHIFQTVASLPEAELPVIPKPDIPTSAESRAMDILNCFLRILADEHDLTPRLLIASDQMLDLVRLSPTSTEDFVKTGMLIPAAADLIGPALLEILGGKRGLCLQQGRGRVVTL